MNLIFFFIILALATKALPSPYTCPSAAVSVYGPAPNVGPSFTSVVSMTKFALSVSPPAVAVILSVFVVGVVSKSERALTVIMPPKEMKHNRQNFIKIYHGVQEL